MKQLFIFFLILSFSLNSTAQLLLNVAGDAQITGRLVVGGTNANMFIGIDAGLNNTTGFRNIFLGQSSGLSNAMGSRNIFIGHFSGQSNTTGILNTCVGPTANVSASNLSNATAIGFDAIVTGSNKVRIGNPEITEIGGQVSWSTLSDGRYKKNISKNKNGLAFILALKPVQYNYDGVKMFKERKARKLEEHQKAMERRAKNNNAQDANISTPPLPDFNYMEKTVRKNAKIVYTGFLAQEVEKAMESTDYVFSGIVKPENEQQKYSLKYGEFVVPLVDAVQQQQRIIEELKTENQTVKEINQALSERLTELENIVAKLVINNEPLSTQHKKLYAAKLEQNLPNPFEGVTKLPYYIPQDSRNAQMKIYNLSGQLLDTIDIDQFGKGEVRLEIEGFSSGQYHYSLEVDGQMIDTKKMNLQK